MPGSRQGSDRWQSFIGLRVTKNQILPTNSICPGEYVAGWAKRGAKGVIGTNLGDARETVHELLENLENTSQNQSSNKKAEAIINLLKSKEIQFVSFKDWKILDDFEEELGNKKGKPREKICNLKQMLEVIQNQK